MQLEPERLLEVLTRHGVRFILIGGYAAAIAGSPFVTFDLDISPDASLDNLARLSCALKELDARMRVEGVDEGIHFAYDAHALAMMTVLYTTTQFGDLDIAFEPSGTRGFTDLVAGAYEVDIDGVAVLVASLADIIRSKEAAGRDKDRRVLPTLRDILRRQTRGS